MNGYMDWWMVISKGLLDIGARLDSQLSQLGLEAEAAYRFL